MCKQVDRGVLSLCLVLCSPSVAKRQLSLLLELKKMTQNHPATKEMGKPFMLVYLATGSLPVVEAIAAKNRRERESKREGEK